MCCILRNKTQEYEALSYLKVLVYEDFSYLKVLVYEALRYYYCW